MSAVPKPDDGLAWRENTGDPPKRVKRVRVVLAGSGREPVYDNLWNAMSPPGWAAFTTRWSLTGHPFDVAWYLPL
jgi:hypothetical protein